MHNPKGSFHLKAKAAGRVARWTYPAFTLLLLAGLLSTGCAETAVGLGVAYAKGNLEVVVRRIPRRPSPPPRRRSMTSTSP